MDIVDGLHEVKLHNEYNHSWKQPYYFSQVIYAIPVAMFIQIPPTFLSVPECLFVTRILYTTH